MPDSPYPLDLGQPMPDASPSTVAVIGGYGKMGKDLPDMNYPSLHLEWDQPYDLPDSGTMVVKFKKVQESTSKRKGNEHQSVTLDILEITSVKPSKEAQAEEDSGDILDRLKKESEDSGEDSGEESAEGYVEE